MRTRVLYITSAFVLCGAVIIWFNKDFFLNLPNFFAWFIAGVTVVFLFVAIIIKNVPENETPQTPRKQNDDYADRREYPRIHHRLSRRPRLLLQKQALEVLDISERGLRFENSTGLQLEDWIQGTLVFSDESTLSINGLVIRKQAKTVCLQLIATIPAEMIARENEHHLSEPEE